MTDSPGPRPNKQFATLAARAALAGVSLYRIDDDRGKEVFVVSTWVLTRELRSLAEVEKWLDRVSGEPT